MHASATLGRAEYSTLTDFLRYPADGCLRYNPCEAVSPASKSPWKILVATFQLACMSFVSSGV
jgi:hypothetical protein